jgi:O-antigen ligase
LAAFNLLVLVSCLNPSFTPKIDEGQSLLAFTGAVHPLLPSTAHPATSLEHLWLFDSIYLSCFNLLLIIRRRRTLRRLLLVCSGNAILLSVFGTFQKFASDGLYFGLVRAPNTRFFATFVYDNHWAAYIVLLIAACAGLVFHYAKQRGAGLFSGSPVILGVIGLLLMAITPTLAGSRAGTLLVMALLGVCVGHALLIIRRGRRAHGESTALPMAGVALCVVITIGGAIYLGRESMENRWRETQGQWQEGILGGRLKLYSDTWQLVTEHPLFGWGLGSFEKVLQLLEPRPLEANRQYEQSYADAHSDWLQSLAETGIAGTLFVLLTGLLPLWRSWSHYFSSPIPAYLLGGCALILLYAGMEFPFGNPAVTIAFWVCFFSAIQYARLQGRNAPMPAKSELPPA